MTQDFDAWLRDARPVTRSIDVCLDRQLVAELEQAEEERDQVLADKMIEGVPADLQARIDRLAAEVQAKTRTLTFKNLGWRRWQKLRGEHPPSEADERDGLDHNSDTFPIAATAECAVDPPLTLEQAERLYETAPPSVVTRIWSTVFLANLEAGDEKKALATAATALTESK